MAGAPLMTMLCIVSYDIADARTRKRVADLLLAEGYERLQWSVFIGPAHPVRTMAMWARLEELVMRPGHTDRMFIIPLPAGALGRMRMIGEAGVDLDLLTGRRQVLFV